MYYLVIINKNNKELNNYCQIANEETNKNKELANDESQQILSNSYLFRRQSFDELPYPMGPYPVVPHLSNTTPSLVYTASKFETNDPHLSVIAADATSYPLVKSNDVKGIHYSDSKKSHYFGCSIS